MNYLLHFITLNEINFETNSNWYDYTLICSLCFFPFPFLLNSKANRCAEHMEFIAEDVIDQDLKVKT